MFSMNQNNDLTFVKRVSFDECPNSGPYAEPINGPKNTKKIKKKKLLMKLFFKKISLLILTLDGVNIIYDWDTL